MSADMACAAENTTGLTYAAQLRPLPSCCPTQSCKLKFQSSEQAPHLSNTSAIDSSSPRPCFLMTLANSGAMPGSCSASCWARHSSATLAWARTWPTLKKWRA